MEILKSTHVLLLLNLNMVFNSYKHDTCTIASFAFYVLTEKKKTSPYIPNAKFCWTDSQSVLIIRNFGNLIAI